MEELSGSPLHSSNSTQGGRVTSRHAGNAPVASSELRLQSPPLQPAEIVRAATVRRTTGIGPRPRVTVTGEADVIARRPYSPSSPQLVSEMLPKFDYSAGGHGSLSEATDGPDKGAYTEDPDEAPTAAAVAKSVHNLATPLHPHSI